MIYELFSKTNQDGYEGVLKSFIIVNHNILSSNNTAIIPSRCVESLFSFNFNAIDISRKDSPIDNYILNFDIDGKSTNLGIGLKTFSVQNNVNMPKKKAEKIAEFDKDKNMFNNKTPDEQIKIVAQLWNDRLLDVKKLYSIDKFIYHCVVRHGFEISFYEFPMEIIDIDNIKIIKKNKFYDGKVVYGTGILNSKSTLQRVFDIGDKKYQIKKFNIDENIIFSKEKSIDMYKNCELIGKDSNMKLNIQCDDIDLCNQLIKNKGIKWVMEHAVQAMPDNSVSSSDSNLLIDKDVVFNTLKNNGTAMNRGKIAKVIDPTGKINKSMISNNLKELLNEGRVVKTGNGGGTKWQIKR